MAEALGIFGAALQIADATVKLKKLWSEVKTAPSQVQELVESITLRAEILGNVERHRVTLQELSDDEILVERCVAHLQNVALKLQVLVNRLDESLKKNKVVGRITTVLKKDELQRLNDRMAEAERFLTMTATAHSYSQQKEQMVIIQETRDLVSQFGSTASPFGHGPQNIGGESAELDTQNTLAQETHAAVLELVNWTRKQASRQHDSLDERLANQNLTRDKRAPIRHLSVGTPVYYEWKIRVNLPVWLTGRGFDFVFSRGYSCTNITLRTFRTLPWDSEVFRAVMHGDLQLLQRAFSNGFSPFDVNELGNSLLDISIYCMNIDILRLLLDYRVRTSEDTTIFALQYLANTEYENVDVATVAIDLLLEKTDVADYDATEIIEMIDNILSRTCSQRTLSLMLRKYSIAHTQLSKSSRARIAMKYHGQGPRPEDIESFLGESLSFNDALDVATAWGSSLPGEFLIGRMRSQEFEQEVDGLKPYVSKILQHKSMFKEISFFRSPLYFHYDDWANFRAGPDHSIQGFRRWLAYIIECEVDIMEYGAWEAANVKYMSFYPDLNGGGWRFVGVQYGLTPEDWHVWVAPHQREYEWAGAFWEWVENPELFNIPGTYPHWTGVTYEEELSDELDGFIRGFS